MLIQNAPPPLRWGGGVPAGGTAHAGHGYYSTIITPYTTDCGNSTGLFQPSRMATREEVYDYLSDKPISITPAARSFDKAALQAFFDGPLRKRIKMEQDQSGKLLEPSNETGQPLGGVPDMGTTPTQEGAPKGEILDESPEPEIPAGSEPPGNGPPPDQPGAVRRGLNIITRGAQGLATVAIPLAAAYGGAVAYHAAFGAADVATGGILGTLAPAAVANRLLNTLGVTQNVTSPTLSLTEFPRFEYEYTFDGNNYGRNSSPRSSVHTIEMVKVADDNSVSGNSFQSGRSTPKVASLAEITKAASEREASPTDNIKANKNTVTPVVDDLQSVNVPPSRAEILEIHQAIKAGTPPEREPGLLQKTPQSGGTNDLFHTPSGSAQNTPLNNRKTNVTMPGAFPQSAGQQPTINMENLPSSSKEREATPVASKPPTPKKSSSPAQIAPVTYVSAINAYLKNNRGLLEKGNELAKKIYNTLTPERAEIYKKEVLQLPEYEEDKYGFIVKRRAPRKAKK